MQGSYLEDREPDNEGNTKAKGKICIFFSFLGTAIV